MACKNVCKLCDRLIISTAVNFDGTNVLVGIPAGSYVNGEKYCIVIAQAIPAAATISSPVIIRIGTSTTNYPLVRCDCAPATACNIRTRTKYSTRVVTTTSGGSFRLLGNVCHCNESTLPAIS